MRLNSLSVMALVAASVATGYGASSVVNTAQHSTKMAEVQRCHPVPAGWTRQAYGQGLLYEWRAHGPIYVGCAGGWVRLQFT